MGKPFHKEIEALPSTIDWALAEDVSELISYILTLTTYSLQAVGSGGSYSAAVFLARLHEVYFEKISKAVSPLEFIQNTSSERNAVCFLSAGGNNVDLLTAWKQAIKKDLSHISAVVMRKGSKVSSLSNVTGGKVIQFNSPCGKDGFLATNSLISTCILLLRAYDKIRRVDDNETPEFKSQVDISQEILSRPDWIVISGGWAWPAAIDLESKCSEAALNHVLLSDLRSFGHGRHLWLAKHAKSTALIVLATDAEMPLVEKMLQYVPTEIPRKIICSSIAGPWATVELLLKVIMVVEQLGSAKGSDPGKPGVPSFGSKLYNIGPYGMLSSSKNDPREVWLNRKMHAMGLPAESMDSLKSSLELFINKLKTAKFSSILLDYDGTLCDPDARFSPLNAEISGQLNRILQGGVRIGVATGRGRSSVKSLQLAIENKYHHRVLVGFYNGACLFLLNEDCDPADNSSSDDLHKAEIILSYYNLGKLELRPQQLTITPYGGDLYRLEDTVKMLLKDITDIKVYRSSHSIDVFATTVGKLLVYERLLQYGNILAIGDSGSAGGNDEELLSTPFSLSCHEPTLSPFTGWHLAPSGSHFSKAVIKYLDSIVVEEKGVASINFKKLERVK